MARADELKALSDEIAELHKKIEALTAAMLQLAVNTPQPYYYPVLTPYTPPLNPYWPPYPSITYSGNTCGGGGTYTLDTSARFDAALTMVTA